MNEKNTSELNLPIYDLNKQLINSLPPMTNDDWVSAENTFNKFLEKNSGSIYLLYGKEIGYFTMFLKEGLIPGLDPYKEVTKSFFEELKDTLEYLGGAKAIDLTETEDALEIWVMFDNEPTVMYLFNYDKGVITYG